MPRLDVFERFVEQSAHLQQYHLPHVRIGLSEDGRRQLEGVKLDRRRIQANDGITALKRSLTNTFGDTATEPFHACGPLGVIAPPFTHGDGRDLHPGAIAFELDDAHSHVTDIQPHLCVCSPMREQFNHFADSQRYCRAEVMSNKGRNKETATVPTTRPIAIKMTGSTSRISALISSVFVSSSTSAQ